METYEDDLKKAIRAQKRLELKNMLEEKQLSMDAASTPRGASIWPRVLAVVGVLLLLLAGWWWLQSKQKPLSNQQMYAAYFTPIANTTYPIIRDTPVLSPEQQALQLYENGDYPAAISAFKALKRAGNTQIDLYLANALMANEEAGRALLLLQKIANESAHSHHQSAQWYLLLTYLYLDNTAAAKKQAETLLQQQSHPYASEASAILKQL